jgi:hypothetical protein
MNPVLESPIFERIDNFLAAAPRAELDSPSVKIEPLNNAAS